MPLRDHFRPPVDNLNSWEELHALWPATIVFALARRLPPRYIAAPRVHLGPFVEVDIAAFDEEEGRRPTAGVENGNGGAVATAVWAPAKPTLAITTDFPAQDEYEVRVYDIKRGRRLVAAIEIVSPGNKDRPEHRRGFVGKCAALLQKQVSVTIVDLVTTRTFNLYGDLLEFIGQPNPAPGSEPPGIYAVACRSTKPNGSWRIETWLEALQIGHALPTLPLWLADDFSIPLNLEESYEETCKVLRIP